MSQARPTPVLRAGSSDAVARAAGLLREGELVIFPTDTVYGIAASVARPDAVAKLFVAKGRPLDRPIPVLISDFDLVEKLAPDYDRRLEPLLRQYWPGALTVVLPAAEWVPWEIVRKTGRVGLRMPDHPVAQSIIRASGGALATTSANRSGERESRTAEEAAMALADRVALIVDGGRTPGGVPSTVIAFDDGNLAVLREGPITLSELSKSLASP